MDNNNQNNPAPQPPNTSPPAQQNAQPAKQGILNQTLGQILQNNPQARNMVKTSMRINDEQLEQMINQANGNPFMNMPVSELFKSGFVQQATAMNPSRSSVAVSPVEPAQNMTGNGQAVNPAQMISGQPQMMQGQAQVMQVTPEQMQQIMNNIPQAQQGQVIQPVQQMQPNQPAGPNDTVPYTLPVQQPKPSFLQKLKGLFS